MQEALFEKIKQLSDAAVLPAGVDVLRGFVPRAEQEELLALCRQIAKTAPLSSPRTRSGYDFSLSVSSVGDWGWFSDERSGYHYRAKHPQTGEPWQPIPPLFAEIARRAGREVGITDYDPDTCLLNFYPKNTGRLGLHQDNTEEDKKTAIVTISLGDSCKFLIGGSDKKDKTARVVLKSGDICIMHGPGRMLYHGVDGLISSSSDLLKDGGRISLTFRRHKPKS